MLLSAEKFGLSLDPPLTKQRVYQLIKRGDLEKTGKKIDPNHPTNAAWLAAREGISHQPKSVGPTKEKREEIKKQRASAGPPPVGEDDIETFDAEGVLEHLATLDIRKLPKADIEKMKTLEAALKTRVERQHKRRELIERSMVAAVFGKLYQVDTNHLRPLGATLAPEVAGLLGSEEPASILAVEKLIDEKIMRVLGHIKEILHSALVSWGETGELTEE